jgi:hypothetical protein
MHSVYDTCRSEVIDEDTELWLRLSAEEGRRANDNGRHKGGPLSRKTSEKSSNDYDALR